MYNKTEITISELRLKAYHLFSGPAPLQGNIMPSIIVKFVHFDDKSETNKNRRMLKPMKNEINCKDIWMQEKIPPLDAFVRKLAENKNLIAFSNNCRIPVMCKNNSGNNVYVKVNKASDVDNLRYLVVKQFWQI